MKTLFFCPRKRLQGSQELLEELLAELLEELLAEELQDGDPKSCRPLSSCHLRCRRQRRGESSHVDLLISKLYNENVDPEII